ncbi:MAG: GNAT family N-acetyltransferase [Arenibacterium sp.]
MFDAVRNGATAYTVPQRRAWLAAPPRGLVWHRKLSRQRVYVARTTCGPVGFVTLRKDGYVDLAFVRAFAKGKGCFRAMMERLIADMPGRALTTHASLVAQPAFKALGFEIVEHEVAIRGGQTLRRAFMQRH